MQFMQLALFQISIQHALHILNAYVNMVNIMESELTFQKMWPRALQRPLNVSFVVYGTDGIIVDVLLIIYNLKIQNGSTKIWHLV